MSYTPGPWKFKTVPTSIGVCHKIGPEPIVDGPHGAICIYDDNTSLNPLSHDELLANARLIAAAPELLEALKEANALLYEMLSGFYPDETPEEGSVGYLIEKAIAKAEGHEPNNP